MLKQKLILFYTMLFSTYYYSIKYDEEKSRNYAYYAIRNIIGIIIFMFLLIFFVTITCIYNININLKGNRLVGYFLMGALIFSYLFLAKKKIKPMFNGIEPKKEKATENFFIWLLFIVGIFGALVYVIPRLLNIYLCS